MPRIVADTGTASYPIVVGPEAVGGLHEVIEARVCRGSRVAIVTDSTVWEALGHSREDIFPDGTVLLILSPGESTKAWPYLAKIYDFLAESGVDRSGLLIALGGGVIGDLAGFAAATFMRGIDYIQAPTTLLAMVDSSVGGKTGININAGKNLVGSFHQPLGVYGNPAWLRTLPPREFSAGMGEVIKYGLINDAELFEDLEAQPLTSPADSRVGDIILRCCANKAAVVAADERETAGSGGRMLLNLGHTFAHAIESVSGYGQLLHGEAVGIGLVLAAELSLRSGRIDETIRDRVRAVVEAHGLPTSVPRRFAVESLLAAMMRDKKWRGGQSWFVLLNGIGAATTVSGVPLEQVAAVWRDAGASDVGVVV